MFREILNRALQTAGNQENLALQMDLSPSALSKKLKGGAGSVTWQFQETNEEKTMSWKSFLQNLIITVVMMACFAYASYLGMLAAVHEIEKRDKAVVATAVVKK
jgi:hypothetical protein